MNGPGTENRPSEALIHQTMYLHLVKIRTLSFVTKSMSKSKGSNYAVEDCQEGDC